MQFWAILGHFGPFWAILCPEFGKSFFPKTRMPQKGTCNCPHWRRLHPPENGKSFKFKIRIPVFWTIN